MVPAEEGWVKGKMGYEEGGEGERGHTGFDGVPVVRGVVVPIDLLSPFCSFDHTPSSMRVGIAIGVEVTGKSRLQGKG